LYLKPQKKTFKSINKYKKNKKPEFIIEKNPGFSTPEPWL